MMITLRLRKGWLRRSKKKCYAMLSVYDKRRGVYICCVQSLVSTCNTMTNLEDILFYANFRVEFFQDFFYFYQAARFGNDEQQLRLEPTIAFKLATDIQRVQDIAQNVQKIMDRNTLPPNGDEMPLKYIYGYTVGIQDVSIIRVIVGTRNQKVEIWLQSFFIHHSDPCKIRPSSDKIQIDVNEKYFYMRCFIQNLCGKNCLTL